MKRLRKYILILFLFSTQYLSAQEICTNGIDDDGDGLVDLNDADCACTGVTPSSLIFNHSFENFTCCPSFYGDFPCLGPISIGTIWNPSSGSPDLFNTCGWTHYLGQVGLLPMPHGNGAAGFFATTDFREHFAGCFSSPLVAGTNYTFQFTFANVMQTVVSGANIPCSQNYFIDTVFMELYGGPNCGSIYNGHGCPTAMLPNYALMSTAAVSLHTQGYQTITMNFTPTSTVNEFIFQFPCNLPAGWMDLTDKSSPGYCSPYAIVDNLILNTTASFSGVSITPQGNVCQNNLSLSASANQGGIFQWYTGGVAIPGQTGSVLNISVLNLPTGMYQVRYENGSDCGIDSAFVTNNVINTLDAPDATVCLGDTAQIIAVGATSYEWFNMDGVSLSNSATLNTSPSNNANYMVVGTLSNGCIDTAVATVNLAHVPNDVTISFSPIPVETETTITLTPINYNYSWTSPDGTISSGNTLYYEFPESGGDYNFLVSAENQAGCKYQFNIPIQISSDLLVYVPNAFTPDGNEYNEILSPIISDQLDKSSYVFTVFNRWGEVVFESRDVNTGWDGTYSNKKCAPGIYSWTIRLQLKSIDEPKTFNGHLNLLR